MLLPPGLALQLRYSQQAHTHTFTHRHTHSLSHKVCLWLGPLMTWTCASQVTSSDSSTVFSNGAGRQAGQWQATLPVPDHSGWIIHHHRHLARPQRGDGAAARSRPDLSVIKPWIVSHHWSFSSSVTADRTDSDLVFLSTSYVTHSYLDSFNPVCRRCECVCVCICRHRWRCQSWRRSEARFF